jgi:DNA adenine methylase Dam
MTYIKSPLNYTGGKFKLLSQIIPLFPKKIDMFLDLFGGGFNVGVNVNAKMIYYNDINLSLVKILKTFAEKSTTETINEIENYIKKYQLSKTNKEGFVNCRKDYNNSINKDYLHLYTLICYAFNYQIRFNSKGEYNMPFGKDRSSFNPSLQQNLINFCEALHSKNCFFTNNDFREYTNLKVDKNLDNDKVLIYCDPPYLNSVATYNENNNWTEKEERDLFDMLNSYTENGIKWALSNDISFNPNIKDFAVNHGYTIHYLTNSYNNCNYHKKDKKRKNIEVLITNY